MITLIVNACGKIKPYLKNALCFWNKYGVKNCKVIIIVDENTDYGSMLLASIVIKKENESLGAIICHLLKEHPNKFWGYIHQDTYIMPGFIEKLVYLFNENQNIGIIIPTTNFSHHKEFINENFCNIELSKIIELSLDFHKNRISNSSAVVYIDTYCLFGRYSLLKEEYFFEISQYNTDFYIFQQLSMLIMNNFKDSRVILQNDLFAYNEGKMLFEPENYVGTDLYIFEKYWHDCIENIFGFYYDLSNYIDNDENLNVLYIGSNAGRQLTRIINKKENINVYAIENDLRYHNVKNSFVKIARWKLDKLEELPYPEVEFNKIILDDVFYHDSDIDKMLCNIKSFIVKGGEVIFVVRHIRCYSLIYDIANDLYRQDAYQNKRFFSGNEINSILQNAGYSIEDMELIKYINPNNNIEDGMRNEMGDWVFYIVRCYCEDKFLPACLRQLEYGIDIEKNSIKIAEGLQNGQYGYLQLAHYIEREVFFKEQMLFNLFSCWLNDKYFYYIKNFGRHLNCSILFEELKRSFQVTLELLNGVEKYGVKS